MLDFMRRQSQKLKWVWVILIFIFSASLVLLYIPMGDLDQVSITNDVASVGSETVSAHEFQTAYRLYVDRMRGQISPEMLKAFRFDRQILDSLITQHVMMEEARRLGLNVSASEIEQKVLQNPVFREGGNFIGLDRYQTILQNNNTTVEEFESSIRDQILMDKLKSFITAGVTVSDKEVEDEYTRRNQKAKLDYIVIDPTKLEPTVTVSEQEQKDYYEKNKAKYNTAEKRVAKYIFVDTLSMRKQVQVSDDELHQYYDQHQSEYTLPERVSASHILFKTQGKTPQEIEAIRAKAQQVLDRARKGEDFATLAKQYSEDSSAANGGDLGFFAHGAMVPEFDKAAFSMQIGQISDLVQSQFGFHIIKVTGKQPARPRTFDEVKEAIRPIISTRKAEQVAADTAQEIAVEFASTKDFAAVAKKHGYDVKETPPMEQTQTTLPDLGSEAELTKRIFAMNKNEIGTALQVEKGYVIPMLSDILPAHPSTFEEAESKVAVDAKAEKARQLATDKGNQLQELAKAGKDLAAIAKAVGAEVKTSDFLTRDATISDFGSISDADKEMFSLPIGKVGTPLTIAGKTLAFAVKERQEVDPVQMKAQMETLRAEMLPTKRETYFNAYIQEVRQKMTDAKQIKVNDAIVEQIAQAQG